MNIKLFDFISELQKLQVDFRLSGSKLEVEAPKGVLTPALIKRLKQNEKKLVSFLQNEKKRTTYKPLKSTEKKEYYLLSSAQRRIFILQKMAPASTFYNMPGTSALDIHIHENQLESIFIQLIQRHESLRTSFRMVDNQPVQVVQNNVDFKIECYSSVDRGPAALETSEVEKKVNSFVRPFDLSKAPLIRVGLKKTAEGNSLLIDMHHIISDGLSGNILRREFIGLLMENKLPQLRFQYKDFVQWQQGKEQKEKVKNQEKFWINQFSGEIPLLNLPTDYPRPLAQSFKGIRASFHIDEQLTKKLADICRKYKSTLFMLLYSIFSIYLAKLSGQEDIIIGIPIANRRHIQLVDIIGLFVNTLAIRNYPARDKRFCDFLIEAGNTLLSSYENQDYLFEYLVENVLIKRNTSRNPLFDVMFNMMNHLDYQGDNLDIDPGDTAYGEGPAKFDLTLRVIDFKTHLYFNLDYNLQLFNKDTIETFTGYFKRIINEIAQDQGKKISGIRLLSYEEQSKKITKFNEDLGWMSKPDTVQEKLALSFEKYKDKIAIEQGEYFVSYSEVNVRSRSVFNYLTTAGFGKGNYIAVYMNDPVERIAAIIGILRAGAIFIPIDINAPPVRIKKMLHFIQPALILTGRIDEDRLVELKPEFSCTEIDHSFYKRNANLGADIDVDYGPVDAIYVYFTSGSGETPRAILGRNIGLMQFIEWEVKRFGINSTFKVSQLANFGFDAYLKDVFVPLFSGGVICQTGNNEVRLEPAGLINWIEKKNLTLIHCVPSLFKTLISSRLSSRNFKHLKYVFLAGEPIHPVYVREWYERFGDRIQLVNLYGLTENTILKTFHVVARSDTVQSRIPIGKTTDGARLLLLDKDLNICPRGTIGEIYIRTPYGTYGYVNDPGLNRERFIKNPFNCTGSIFKTGDLGRELKKGDIEYIGRIDQQVKIRGNRVELEEIEKQLLKITGIREAVVTARDDESNSKYLCTYIVVTGTRRLNIGDIRKELSKNLPGYMIPSYLVQLEKIPLTQNGKLNRGALPEPAIETGRYTAPANEVELELQQLWSKILNIDKEKISIHADFFELGGHSLKMMEFAAGIYNLFAVEPPIGQMYQEPNIKSIAQMIVFRKYEEEPVLLMNKLLPKKIFFFPPAVGYGLVYKELANALEDYSLYAFNFIESENRLEEYVKLILTHQPRGSFVFGAWSAGGRLLFNVARAIEKAGHTVSDVLLLDSKWIDKSTLHNINQTNEEKARMFIHEIENWLKKMGMEYLKEKVLAKMSCYYKFNKVMHEPVLINADIHYILAQDGKHLKESYAWKNYTSGSFIMYHGFGEHGNMLEDDYLEKNALIIKEILDTKCF